MFTRVARNTGICSIYEQNEGNTGYLISITHKTFVFHETEARLRALYREGGINIKSFLKSCNLASTFTFKLQHTVVLQASPVPQLVS